MSEDQPRRRNPEHDRIEIETARIAATSARNAFLARWCFRWMITIVILAWFLPQHLEFWWLLLILVPMGCYSLYTILSHPRRVAARRMEELAEEREEDGRES